MRDSQQHYGSKGGFSKAQKFVHELIEDKCLAQLSIPVILSIPPAGQVDAGNDQNLAAPALLPVLAFSRRTFLHRRECLCHKMQEHHESVVIGRAAPRQIIPHLTEGREVEVEAFWRRLSRQPKSRAQAEGAVEEFRKCLQNECCVKAFSRELPDAPRVRQTFPGSFDSPLSRKAGRGLAQDDRGKVHRKPLHPSFLQFNFLQSNYREVNKLHG